jgi:hypothetical protein
MSSKSNKLEAVKSQIQYLETVIAEKNSSFELIRDAVSNLMIGYQARTYIYPQAPNYVYRARINRSEEPFNHKVDLWYPPKEKLNKYGRLNIPTQQVFYVSTHKKIALSEVDLSIGDIVTILKCKRKSEKPMTVMELGLSEKASQYATKKFDFIRPIGVLPQDSSKYNEEEKAILVEIRSFLAREFLKIVPNNENYKYKITAALAEIQMLAPIDGIWYPSIANSVENWDGESNFGLKTESADMLYDADSCCTYRVEQKSSSEKLKLRCLSTSEKITPDGEIHWNKF